MEDSLAKLDTHPCTKDQPVCSCMSSNIVCKKIIFDTKISTLLTNNQSFFYRHQLFCMFLMRIITLFI